MKREKEDSGSIGIWLLAFFVLMALLAVCCCYVQRTH